MSREAMTNQDRTTARRRMARSRRIVARIGGAGFTLAELLVAVGVVAILTLGIGRIFASVTKLVGTGAAVGEVDQIARVIENQLRADFEAASRLGARDNFLAIRNRRVGDINNNGDLDGADEVDIYLTRDDEEADQRRNVDPYQRSTVGTKPAISKAISVRLDQIMFLGASPEGYRSFQPPPASEQVVPHALIMWGHALRPPVDAEAVAQDRPPYRLNYPDGDFGFARGDENPFAPSDSQIAGDKSTGRNRYAGDFILARQAILLAGGVAGGEDRVIAGGRQTPLFGKDTEVALYPRDIEAAYLFERDPPPSGRVCFKDYEDPDAEALSDGDGGPDGWGGVDLLPNPRLIRHGRTDILAVDRDGFQRWIEGTGVPFSAGRLGDSAITTSFVLTPNAPNCRLWAPRDPAWTGSNNLRNQYHENLMGVQSAIAGMFHRVLVESEPPAMRIDPEDPDTGYPDPALSNFAKPDPRDKRMDMAAIMASHCSSFEVAWSDGSTWFKDQTLRLDANGDGKIDREIRRGDTIWFDMDFTVRDFWRLNNVGDDGSSVNNQNASVYPRPNPDPEIGLTSDRVFDWMPNRFPSNVRRDQTHINALAYRDDNTIETSPNTTLPAYCPKWNAMPFAPVDNPQPRPEQEYLAIWGFQMPEGADQGNNTASVGGYGASWPKPQLIRIRMTLHDSQNRLEGGKQFEFVFRLDGGRS